MLNSRGKFIIGLLIAGLMWITQSVIFDMAVAAPYVYVANNGSSTVSVIDTNTNSVINTISVGSGPWIKMAISPNGKYVYVVNRNANNISVVDTTTNLVIATIPVGSEPIGVAVKPDGSCAYVTNCVSKNVSVIDMSSNTVIGTITVGPNPHGIVISPDGRYAYVVNRDSGGVSVIDTSSNSVIATIPLSGYLTVAAITPDNRYVYVGHEYTNNVSVIDTDTNVVTTTIPVGTRPWGLEASPDGRYVYVINHGSSNVSVIDTTTNSVIATIPVGNSPYGAAISPESRYVYVSNVDSNNVSVIDTVTNSVIATIPVDSQPFGIAIAPEIPTVFNTQITNGTDTGNLNDADIPGDVILSYTSGNVHKTVTCNLVSTTIDQVYGLSLLPQPADKSGTYNTNICYTYWLRNTGNGTDTIGLTTSNSWLSTIIQDNNQDGIHQATETTAITQLVLAPNQVSYFFLQVQIPATATTGQQSTATLTAKDHNATGTDDNWGDPDMRTDEVVTLCSVGMPALITVIKERDKSQVKPGDTITYTITYKNVGSPATDIEIIDCIPANTTLAEPATGTETTVEYYVNNAWTATFSPTATKVKWTRTTPLSANSEATVRFTVQVK